MSTEGAKYDPSRTYMLSRVAQPAPRLRFVGVLRPERGLAPAHVVHIEGAELVIGRQEGLDLTLGDDWVSRRHARVRRSGDDFILEDLDSSNGTYVDGVPVRSCILRSGDWIQIGRSLFRFEVQLAGVAEFEDVATWLE